MSERAEGIYFRQRGNRARIADAAAWLKALDPAQTAGSVRRAVILGRLVRERRLSEERGLEELG